jgi:hypothetical protein
VPDEQQIYIKMDVGWTVTACPLCEKTATSHGWLFSGPQPGPPLEDNRNVIGEVFIHDGSEYCVRPPSLALILK